MLNLPIPDPQKERELLVSFADGNQGAGREIIEGYMPMVMRIVSKYCGPGTTRASLQDADDLIQAGNMALMTALGKFNLTRGDQFSAFVIPHIRGAISNEIQKQYSIPRGFHRVRSIVEKLIDELMGEFDCFPSAEETYKKFLPIWKGKYCTKTIHWIPTKKYFNDFWKWYNSSPQPIHTGVNESTNNNGHMAGQMDSGFQDIENKIDVKNILNCLSEGDVEFIQKLFGLNGYPTISQKEFAIESGNTQQAISQKLKRILRDAKKFLAQDNTNLALGARE